MKKVITSLLFLCPSLFSFGQFAGPAGSAGSTAMHRDSAVFINWASSAELELGLMDISNEFSGTVNSGDANSPLGFPDGACISLGDSGVAILAFPQGITNGTGPDFAVFENAFSDAFLELAFVEVSSDGINFTRFPATSNTQTSTQIGPFQEVGDATLLNNLAGKYRLNFGTPFDLEELNGTPGLDISAITRVKIIDVVGMVNGDHVQYDSNGNAINDPYATAFPQGGFDLDAIGVIHQGPLGIKEDFTDHLQIYPNPVLSSGTLFISTEFEVQNFTLLSLTGEIIVQSDSNSIMLDDCPRGVYFIQIQTSDFIYSTKVIVQ